MLSARFNPHLKSERDKHFLAEKGKNENQCTKLRDSEKTEFEFSLFTWF